MPPGGVAVGVLGPLVVAVDGAPVNGLPAKERALVELLALSPGRSIGVSQIIAALWEDEAPRSPRKGVQVLVSRLRQRLGTEADLVRTEGDAYLLDVAPDAVDVVQFERLLANGRAALNAGRADAALDALDAGLDLWRGDPLIDLGESDVGRAERARLDELHAVGVGDRVDARLALGHHRELISELEAAVTANPLRERRWRQLMLALYRSGRQADALRAYQRVRTTLVDQLGIEPGAELRDLEAAMIRHDPALDVGTNRAVLTRRRVGWAERVAEGPFVGRVAERTRIEQAWSHVRTNRRGGVVVLTGDGGIGKSRLAAEFAVDASGDGAFVIAGPCAPDLGLVALWEGFVEMARTQGSDVPLPESLDELVPLDEAVAHRYADVMATLLTERAEVQPVIIVLDDLHLADDVVLVVIRRLVHRLTRSPILALATYRADHTAATGVLDLWNELHQAAVSELVPLAGLPDRDALALVAAWADDEPPVGASERLVADTGGNPRYLIELVRNRVWGGVAAGVPESLRAFVSRNLDDLTDDVAPVLAAAAVVGETFTLDGLERVSDADRSTALDALDQAVAAHLVRETEDGYAFATAVERQVVLDRLSAGRRSHLEERLGT